jgi:hypothetical protein
VMIDYPPFEAARTLFEDTTGTESPRLPADLDQLLELALSYQECFKALNLDNPPTGKLQDAAVIQYRIIAALYDDYARPLFHVTHGQTTTVALLYGEMVRRLLTHTEHDQEFARRTSRSYLHPLGKTFALVTHQIHSECLKVSGLPVLTQHCADYLNYLAFAVYKLTQTSGLIA